MAFRSSRGNRKVAVRLLDGDGSFVWLISAPAILREILTVFCSACEVAGSAVASISAQREMTRSLRTCQK